MTCTNCSGESKGKRAELCITCLNARIEQHYREGGKPFDGSEHFDGATYEPALDQQRLTGQLQKMFVLIQDGRWWTYEMVRRALPELNMCDTSISSRFRDLRKEKFGEYDVPSIRVGGKGGLWAYQFRGKKKKPGAPVQMKLGES